MQLTVVFCLTSLFPSCPEPRQSSRPGPRCVLLLHSVMPPNLLLTANNDFSHNSLLLEQGVRKEICHFAFSRLV